MAGNANRAMLLTPAGSGAIAVVRVLGPGVAEFLQRRFSRAATAGRCVHGDLRDDAGNVIDDIVALLRPDGSAADLNVHGGPWVVESVLNLLRAEGFGEAEALDAFDSADVIEREMLASLPRAKTEAGIRMLLAQPALWREFVRSKPSREAVQAMLGDRTLERMLNPARVAIVGAPNVGKSTLANQLFGQERSITADLPGTTRDWVGELADVNGVPVLLMDTPGVRESADAIEQSAIALSRGAIESAELVIVVIDPTQDVSNQLEFAEGFASRVVVWNKSDIAKPQAAVDVETVATRGEGLDRLRELICARLGCVDLLRERAMCWTQRQREELASLGSSS